ncbi:peptide deformylase [Amphibiibacter pelophylacis]|uniref:Peptide deformylase n=1 Tax=Amphibiibacter pelophylacis TaxID=1799477 RepID=A0ACC6P1L4_9BURK
MSTLAILRYPHPRLHLVATPVEEVDDSIRQLCDDMLETMYASNGVGLAATQVDVQKRLLVMDLSEDSDAPQVYINPEIIWRSDEKIVWKEGCLSVPTVFDEVQRHAQIRVRALGRDGQPFEVEASELHAVCLQHEIDHLDGKVFVEYLSPLKARRIKTKMQKMSRDDVRGG